MVNGYTQENLTVEQKFAKIMLKLRSIRPFYSAVYEVMEKVETNSIDTVGVSTNKLIYNRKFIDETSVEDLLFIMLHEVGHIALKHVARREGRNPNVWNIACDLYVNKMLANEFQISPGERKELPSGAILCMPTGGVYCSTLDVNKEYVEEIYDKIMDQLKGSSYESESNSMALNGSQSGVDPNKTYSFEYTGKNRAPWGSDKYDTFNGKVSVGGKGDLIDEGEDSAEQGQKADKIVADAVVRTEMTNKDAGTGAGALFDIVKKMLVSQVDWRKLLRKYLIASKSKDSSFSRPDKRMYYQKCIYPGQEENEDGSIRGVKICIDTSGSISDKELMYFFGQVSSLCDQFDIEAEVVYWDTVIQSLGSFRDYNEFKRINLGGGGGTDPSCIFNYFDSKQCKVKPLVTLVFTDGVFSMEKITGKQRRKYKDTIWVMSRNGDANFKPSFGKKAFAKFPKSPDT